MNRRAVLRFAASALVGTVAFIVIGTASSHLARARCLKAAAIRAYRHLLSPRNCYVYQSEDSTLVAAALESVGVSCSSVDREADRFPYIEARAHVVLPFVVSVEYFAEREAEIGEGETLLVVCVFGAYAEVGRIGHKVS